MQFAIRVENLSKSYLVGHNNAKAEGYTALRDVLSRNARNLVRKTRDMLTGRQIVQGDEVEEFWALKDINFEIQAGDRVGIIGRNGAGKSTLLKILSRITEPTTGRVTLNGRVASLLEVGTGFHPELTGRENIFLNGAILGMSRKEIQHKFDEIVDFAEVEKFLDTPVKRYSSGMYVRLAFAVAAHLEPEILVVDEVLAVGDAQFQKKCLGKMEDVGKSGRTVLFVSHNMAAIRSLCTRGIVLMNGEMLYDGDQISAIHENIEKTTHSSQKNIDPLSITKFEVGKNFDNSCDSGSKIEMFVEFATKVSLSESHLNIVIEDCEGRVVIHKRTDQINIWPNFSVGSHKIEITLESMYLTPGVYSVWFRLYCEEKECQYTADSERCILEIRGHNIGSGVIDVPSRWRINGELFPS